MDKPPEEEWEYEYDENETEDFYVTLDLSQLPDRGDSSNPTYYIFRNPGGRRSVFFHRRIKEHDYVHSEPTGNAETQGGVNEQDFAAFGEVQFSGLETVHPLANFNGELISLKWASSLGSDLLFTKPNPNIEPLYEPLRSLSSADLVGVSSAKLTATLANIHPKESTLEHASRTVPDTASQASAAQAAVAQASTSEDVNTGKRRPDKAGFHALLNAAKAKRREKSTAMANQQGPAPSTWINTTPGQGDAVDHHRETIFFPNDPTQAGPLRSDSQQRGSPESDIIVADGRGIGDEAEQGGSRERSVAAEAVDTNARGVTQPPDGDVVMDDAPE